MAKFPYRTSCGAGSAAPRCRVMVMVALCGAAPVSPSSLLTAGSPVMVTVEYQIDPTQAAAFAGVMRDTRRARLRQGALSWGLFRDTTLAGRYIEYFSPRIFREQQEAFFVDAGLSYSGPPANVFSGLEHLEGEVVAVSDSRLLDNQVAELGRGKQIEVLRRNGFEGLKSLLPTLRGISSSSERATKRHTCCRPP